MIDDLPLEERIVAAIRQIMRAVDLHSRRLLEEYGLTGPQLATLQEAARLGPVSSGALARAVHLSHPTVTGILTRLEKRGLLTRARGDADRRTVTVTLTTAGREVLARAPSLLQDHFRRELSGLEEWERLMALTVLQRVAAMMGAGSVEAVPHLVGEGDLRVDPTEHEHDEAGDAGHPDEAGAPDALGEVLARHDEPTRGATPHGLAAPVGEPTPPGHPLNRLGQS